jgi:transposase
MAPDTNFLTVPRWHDRQYHRPGAPLRSRHKKGTQKTEALGRSRGGFTTKLHARCDAKGRPLGFVLTGGEAHDIKGFAPLMRMIADKIEALLADKGYDADAIREELAAAGVEAVIPAKRNRKNPAPHDAEKYKWRNLIERLFSKLKNWRRVATRYDKTAQSYLGFVAIAAVKLWLPFVHEA